MLCNTWIIFFFKKIFVYLFLAASGLCCWGLSLVVADRGSSPLRCKVLSLQWLPLQSTGFRACGLSSCRAQTKLPHGTWNLPGPGIEPVLPALAGGFLTTEPPGKFLGHPLHWGICAQLFPPSPVKEIIWKYGS